MMNIPSSNLILPSLSYIPENDVVGFETFDLNQQTDVITKYLINPFAYAQDILNLASSNASSTYATQEALTALLNDLDIQLNIISATFKVLVDYLELT